MDYSQPPGFYEDKAREAEALALDANDPLEERPWWQIAREAWKSAAAVSVGHNRRDRYRRQAAKCERHAIRCEREASARPWREVLGR